MSRRPATVAGTVIGPYTAVKPTSQKYFGLTMEEAAELLGSTKQRVSQMENQIRIRDIGHVLAVLTPMRSEPK
jgi:hypothetical protein